MHQVCGVGSATLVMIDRVCVEVGDPGAVGALSGGE